MKTVEVRFDEYGKHYHYLFPYEEDIAVGDSCVIQTGSTFKVVKVTQVIDGRSDKATRPVIQKINTQECYTFEEKERKRKNIKHILNEKVKEFNEVAVFEILASKDSYVADLVKQLKELN